MGMEGTITIIVFKWMYCEWEGWVTVYNWYKHEVMSSSDGGFFKLIKSLNQ